MLFIIILAGFMFLPVIGKLFDKPIEVEVLPTEEVIEIEVTPLTGPYLSEEECELILEALREEFPNTQLVTMTTIPVSADCRHLEGSNELVSFECRLSDHSQFGQTGVPLEVGRFWFTDEPTVLVEINSVNLINVGEPVDGLTYWVCAEVDNWFTGAFDNYRTVAEVWIIPANS